MAKETDEGQVLYVLLLLSRRARIWASAFL